MKLPIFTALEWALGIVVLIAAAVLLWNFDPFGRRHRAEEKAATATVQAEVNQGVAEATAGVARETDRIHRKAQEAKDALATSTDYDGDLAIWSAGVDGLLGDGSRTGDQPSPVPSDPSGEPVQADPAEGL